MFWKRKSGILFIETQGEKDEMLQYIAEKSTDFLISKTEIKQEEREIYYYGFELFWSTFLSVSSMILLAIAFNYVPQIVVFILFFIPIRIVAGGAHASSYRNCWWISNLLAIGCVVTGSLISKQHFPVAVSAILLIVAMGYIWKTAPVQLTEAPLKDEYTKRNRKYGHLILMIEAVWFVVILSNGNSRMYYTAAITSYIVAIMIWITIKEERRKCNE